MVKHSISLVFTLFTLTFTTTVNAQTSFSQSDNNETKPNYNTGAVKEGNKPQENLKTNYCINFNFMHNYNSLLRTDVSLQKNPQKGDTKNAENDKTEESNTTNFTNKETVCYHWLRSSDPASRQDLVMNQEK